MKYLLSLFIGCLLSASCARPDRNVYEYGGIVRTDTVRPQISLIFTAADRADGAATIINTLKRHNIKGSFFFTGEFFHLFPDIVKRLRTEGHYVGSHSYGHLLYCSWDDRQRTLVTKDEFMRDLEKSYAQLAEFGISKADAPLFVPPYEYYNDSISAWTAEMGLRLVNYTGGTLTNGDYTTPEMKNYYSSQRIFDHVMRLEAERGMNGYILLIHLGTDEARTDKFYDGYLDRLIETLQRRGYRFVPLREAVG
ncbi:MAG: polysaccharide deacetylase family protein [Prevotellaceae bacterium]|jgi:peptidoglycan/xylan/chitin deacetylase (PgdA/CDA1 family)|nr:polysaccharide deacetylase family protein [Prevotellaceae bacterium]